MHPEIKKFWEQIGKVDFTLIAPNGYYVVEVEGLKYVFAKDWVGSPQDGPEQPTKYFYKGITYSEKEMLKIISLKAFL